MMLMVLYSIPVKFQELHPRDNNKRITPFPSALKKISKVSNNYLCLPTAVYFDFI